MAFLKSLRLLHYNFLSKMKTKIEPTHQQQDYTIWPCMEYCYHVWAGVPSCNFELLDKLQKQISRTAGLSLAASLEPLAHRNAASLNLFYRCYFGRCSSELAELVPLPYS